LKPGKPNEAATPIEVALFKRDLEPSRPASPLSFSRAVASRPARQARAPGPRQVRRQIEQIFSSDDFDASRRSRDFLRFIVEETLAGRAEDLTQPAIATRVFARQADFDAVVDPIVRIQAGRLRRSLERYYLLSGKHDPVRIELPRGTYVPTFNAQSIDEPEGAADGPQEPALLADDWPSLAISPFKAAAGSDQAELADRVTEEVALELGRYRDVRAVVQNELDKHGTSGRRSARFALGGRLRVEDGALLVTAQLVDRASGEQLWGDEYHTQPRPGRWSGSPGDVARVIAARVGAEEGVVVQHLAAEHRKRKPASLTPYGAILLSYEFFLTRNLESLPRALAALRQVVDAEPDLGVVWTRLARLCLANYAFELSSLPTPLEETITSAQRGVRLDPSSRRARCILAAGLLVKGELSAAREQLEDALRLGTDSLVWLEIIGYLLTLVGDGRGPAIIRTARDRNPHCLPHASMGLWFDHLRRGETELAYGHALEQRDPTFFWRGVMRASCLGHLGRGEEAAVEVAELLRDKPDFRARGRILIGHYVKFPEVMEPVVEGLAKAGLKLD
jgi:TolB-like protein